MGMGPRRVCWMNLDHEQHVQPGQPNGLDREEVTGQDGDYGGVVRNERALAARRALAVCRALRAAGAKVRYTTVGYGGVRPVVVGGTARTRPGEHRGRAQVSLPRGSRRFNPTV